MTWVMAKMNRMTKHQQASNSERKVIDVFTQHKMDVSFIQLVESFWKTLFELPKHRSIKKVLTHSNQTDVYPKIYSTDCNDTVENSSLIALTLNASLLRNYFTLKIFFLTSERKMHFKTAICNVAHVHQVSVRNFNWISKKNQRKNHLHSSRQHFITNQSSENNKNC